MRPPSSFRTLCARHIRNFAAKAHTRPLLPLTLPLDTLFCLFRLPLFPQAVQGSAFLYVFVSCGTCVLSPTKTSTFIEVFARLCIFIHCVIACSSPIRLLLRPCDPFPVVAPRLTIAPRRRSLTPGSASRRVARVPSHRFAFAFSFRDRVSRPHFLDIFSSHTCDRRDVRSFCLMLQGAPQTFCFFSAFGFSRFPFEDQLRIFARL